ncbi:MAG: TldD/PmbA family protein [Elusimicrobia bacterium]|nr:TldD/PmbA family protein [Elusimicrobiota bacterium]
MRQQLHVDHPMHHLTFGDYADLYCEEVSNLSLGWEEGHLEKVTTGVEQGVGLRYLVGEETRFAHIDGLQSEALERCSRALTKGLKPVRTLPDQPTTIREARCPVEQPPEQVPMDRKVALLEAAFAAVHQFPHIRQVVIRYGEARKRIQIFTSEGEVSNEERLYLTFSLSVIAEKEGLLQTAYEVVGGLGGFELIARHDVAALARLVATRAVAKLSAPPAPVGEMPVIIAAEAGGTLIHEAIGHSLEADGVQKGISPVYKGKRGQVVANEIVTVYDDPTLPGHRGSYAFDDEGVPAQRAVLIDHGVLTGYLYDRFTARKDGVPSNGHGRRESFHHRPIPRMANTYVAQGTHNPQEILRSIPSGLLVTRMGGGQVDTATGDFVFEVEEGFVIQNGSRGPLVRGATLLGNGPRVLRSIDLVGSDLGWGIGTCGKDGQGAPVSDGVPTLRIPKLVVGGSLG